MASASPSSPSSASADSPGGAPGTAACPALNAYSCLSCRRKKKKCNRIYPCNNCQRLGTECVFAQRRVSARQKPSAMERLRHLESVVGRLRSDLDVRPPHADKHDPPGNSMEDRLLDTDSPDMTNGQGLSKDQAVSGLEAEFGKLAIADGRSRYVVGSFWASLAEEVEDLRSLLNEDSNDGQRDIPASVPSSCHSCIFGFGCPPIRLLRHHPHPSKIPLYWRLFKENCDPLIKVLHIPTTEPFVFQAAAQLEKISTGLEALMFAVYYSAVASLAAGECVQLLGIEREILLSGYQSSLEHALARARLLETEEIIVLQAFVIFLTSLRNHCNVRLTWTLTALAVRLAQNAGLHRDGSHFNLSPFVVEMRRRLWWSLCVLDSRAAEDTGYDAAIPNEGIDTQLPLNVNDSDLAPNMTELPQPRHGLSEMTFAVVRYEATKTFRRLQYVSVASVEKGAPGSLSLIEKGKWILDCQSRTYESCLKQLDLTDPFSWYIVAVSRIVFTKMWLIAHHSCLRMDKGAGLRPETKDRLFTDSIGTIESWLLLLTEANTAKWRWLCETYVQWYALTFILSELCVRTHGDLVDRAWRAVEWAFQIGLKGPCTGLPDDTASDPNACDAYKPLTKLLRKARSARASHLSTHGIRLEIQPGPGMEGGSLDAAGQTPFGFDKLDLLGGNAWAFAQGSPLGTPDAGSQQQLLSQEWSSFADTVNPSYDDGLLNWTDWDPFSDGSGNIPTPGRLT